MPTRKTHKPTPSASGTRTHRHTLSLQKTEILINVYDLLPPGRVASLLWHLGTALLHSGVVINGREYAYGGHDQPGITGVYWTRPRTQPPGGTFRCELLHGFTLAGTREIDAIVREASEAFLGTGYNLLTRNCNHFTSYLCERLTGKPAPGFLNRAASIGVALPCVVPREWVEVPDFETADGELMEGVGGEGHGGRGGEEEEEEEEHGERTRMLRSSDEQPRLVGREEQGDARRHVVGGGEEWDGEEEGRRGDGGRSMGKAAVRDTAGRRLPPAERAPVS